jgi:hypothetical protein
MHTTLVLCTYMVVKYYVCIILLASSSSTRVVVNKYQPEKSMHKYYELVNE